MAGVVSLKPTHGGPPPAVVDDREVRKLAVRYALRMAQIRGLIALHGNDTGKLDAAVRRLKRQPH